MAEVEAAPDVRALEDAYDIRGELRGSDSARYYIGSAKGERAAEVAIAVFNAPKGGENNALSHLASDTQILQGDAHPTLARVIDGRWVGNNAFAVITAPIQGETLRERIERGEKFSNPRVAMMLQEVSGVLDWAREHGIVHRGVTPDSLYLERGTNRLRVALTPTPIPMSGVPDACGDARTLGRLAWSMLTGQDYEESETPRSLGEASPNLATRVVDATDKMIACKDHAEAPDVATFLGIIASGDVLKEAEVQMAAQKEEYDEQHRQELQKCEIQREQIETHAQEQAAMLAGEREEFLKQMADERAAIEAERVQMEALAKERQDRLAAVRAELDQQRTELERRLAELEKYRQDVEKVRDDAVAARESAKQASAAATAAAAAAAKKSAALEAAALASRNAAAAPGSKLDDETVPVPAPIAETELAEVGAMPSDEALVPVVIPADLAKAPKLAKPPKPPKWSKLERVDLEHTDNVELPSSRPRWMIPAGVATLALLIIAVIFGLTHRSADNGNSIHLGKSTVVPTAPGVQGGYVPTGGFLTQSAGGNVANKLQQPTSPAVPADSAAAVNAAAGLATPGAPTSPASAAPPTAQPNAKPSVTHASADSVEAAAERRAARLAAQQREERRREQAIADSLAEDPARWNNGRGPLRTSRPDSVATPRRDSVGTPRRDTTIRRDSVRPDTLKRR